MEGKYSGVFFSLKSSIENYFFLQRLRAIRQAKSLCERSVTELILQVEFTEKNQPQKLLQ